MSPRGRLAPSPTGVLHLGNARSFLLAWLDVRARGGEILLRVEDLDGPRVQTDATERALEDLRWLGLDWDGDWVLQSTRLARHAAALDRLHRQGLAYPCVCTRKDVSEAASAPHAGQEGPVYPGTCRGRFADAEAARTATGREPAWRFAVPEHGVVDLQDRVLGARRFDVGRELGDFVIWKKDGEPAYQLAVVVDDAEQGIDSVLRGDDLLPSAARQALLYRSLGWPEPEWAHVPLVVGADGRRLAKRHGDTTVRSLRESGVTPCEVLTLLAHWSGLAPGETPRTARELAEGFELARVPRDPVVWQPDLAPWNHPPGS